MKTPCTEHQNQEHEPGIIAESSSGDLFVAVHDAARAWFCIRSRPKHEHLTAAYLRDDLDIEVYLPRVRFKRSTRTGPKWFTEALFPSYLFARFNLFEKFRQVHHGHGAQGILHFGNHWPTIPDSLIQELRQNINHERPLILSEEFRPGDPVLITGGPLHDLQAVVTQIMPSKARVAVLLEFLGRQTTVELATEDLLRAPRSPSTSAFSALARSRFMKA